MSRNSELAQIHIAKKQLGMDEETYRMMLHNVTGKDSTKEMDIQDRYQVLAHLKKVGFKARRGKQRLSPKTSNADQRSKIRAVWIAMFKDGFIQDGSETALDAWVRRMTKLHVHGQVDSVAWLTSIESAQFVLEALKKWQKRLEQQAQQEAEL